MHFKTMDPDLVRQLIADQPDIISEAAEREAQLYRNARCPMCLEQGCEKRFDAPKIIVTPDGPTVVSSPFGKGLLVKGYAICMSCGTQFNPHTGVIRHSPSTLIHDPPQDLP